MVADSMQKLLRGLSLAVFLVMSLLASELIHLPEMNAWAGSLPSAKSTKAVGDAERGRGVFNGKGT